MEEYKFIILDFYKKHRNFIKFSGLFLISFAIQILVLKRPFDLSIGSSIVQLISSFLISLVLVQLYRKYHEASLIKWWIVSYIILMILSILALAIETDFYP